MSYVNAVLVLVVATCVVGPILSQRYGQQVKNEAEAKPLPASPPAPISEPA